MGHYNHVGNHHRVTAEHGFHLLVLAQGVTPSGWNSTIGSFSFIAKSSHCATVVASGLN